MAKRTLPDRAQADAAWETAPPDPLDDPDLYDGLPWRRPLAYLLDASIVAVAAFVLWLALGLLTILSLGLLFPVKVVALAVLPIAYHTYFIGAGGATPGMRFFDVEVRTWTGARPDYARGFLMTVLFYATVTLTSWLILALCLFNDRRRTLHDYLAGTVAVRHTRVPVAGLRTVAAS